MRWLFIFLACLGVTRQALTQSHPAFLVEYLYEQRSVPLISADSAKSKKVQVIMDTKDSVDGGGEGIQMKMADLNVTIDFIARVYMIANADSSKQYFKFTQDEESSIKTKAMTPDTIYFKQGVWKAARESITELLPVITIEVIETNEHRPILGYDCIKFISSGTNAPDEISFWACKKLPNTLLPYVGLHSFKYGILAIEHKKNNWRIEANSIERL